MGAEKDQPALQMGPLEVDLENGFARVDGRAVVLTEHELKLLVALMHRGGRVVRRDELFQMVWGDSMRRGERSVDVYIFKLRGKLEGALPGWDFIHTHTGWGYRLDPEWREPPQPGAAPLGRRGNQSRRSGGSDTGWVNSQSTNYLQGRHT